MPLDFPSNPSDGQVYDNYYYDAAAGVWQSNAGTILPNIFKDVVYTSSQTYKVPVTSKGKLGQTANLQEWVTSDGTVKAKIDPSGNITVNSITTTVPIASVPTGALLSFAGTTAPAQFLMCDGSAVSRTTYADLFAIIGTTYGAGNGTTTFNLPNPNGRVIAGKASSGTFATLGSTGGYETHTLTSGEMPVHAHSIDHDHAAFTSGDDSPDHSHSTALTYGATHNSNGGYAVGAAVTTYWTAYFGSGGASTRHQHNINVPNYTGASGNAGSGSAHNNLQPYIVTNYIIKT